MSNILIIDDDAAICRMLELHLQHQNHDSTVTHNVRDGLASARALSPDLIILDIRMPETSGLEGLPEFKTLLPDTPVIMITAHHDMDSTIEAMKLGASDYIHKPIDLDELDEAVSRSLDSFISTDDTITLLSLTPSKTRQHTIAGHSRGMKDIFKTIGLVAPKPITVLITGESGTGKELVARTLHASGIHPDGPFIPVNCAALVETLLESDLFGHEKGAFTGATERHIGKFSMADNGTIFLDEVGDLSTSVQAKLLRVLQEKECVPVGGNEVKKTNARVIAATNVDLQQKVCEGEFREDLYYRLQVVTIHAPPLRDRMEDIPDLIESLLAKIKRDMNHKVTRLTTNVIDAFQAYNWPGNIRELENVLLKAAAICPGDVITIDLIPEHIQGKLKNRSQGERPLEQMSLDDANKVHVSRVLQATHWHRGQTCQILGISRPRLRRLIKQYDLVAPTDAPND